MKNLASIRKDRCDPTVGGLAKRDRVEVLAMDRFCRAEGVSVGIMVGGLVVGIGGGTDVLMGLVLCWRKSAGIWVG